MKKTVLVTGASSGIGRQTARLFRQNGWNVIASMRNPENETELNALENVWVSRLDVTDQASIDRTISEGIARFGTIDALVNSAGYGLFGAFESIDRPHFQQQFDVNVFGLMEMVRAVLPVFRAQKTGVIINISSYGGQVALPFATAYAASKFAVEGFSESLSHELYPLGITVKIVEPGSIATNFRNSMQFVPTQIDDYSPVVSSFFSRSATPTAHLQKATEEQVAQTIYLAATDGKQQLRYVIGDDAQFYIDQKYKQTDEAFVTAIREYFVN
ncbi:SDR family oxidoreductase [Dyadobacter sandarakinus]|uniref:SDR family oxidoreductase n=1 Tax=Dyadobacter sandarakinus TaxID=2747268 RepID=A0ABX7I642_9BACT|nr:SDR family oxidoreductase [Dyadobacter sandarakinus]QRR01415.1 SDR family oxidoreductase [Dyadobacter sandarakinus]